MNDSHKKDFSIRYDKSEITYITQFLVSPGNEELLLDLSSGLLKDGSNPQTLPIQTRIALPWSTADRLAKMLAQLVESKRQQLQKNSTRSKRSPHTPKVPEAVLPQMSSNVQSN